MIWHNGKKIHYIYDKTCYWYTNTRETIAKNKVVFKWWVWIHKFAQIKEETESNGTNSFDCWDDDVVTFFLPFAVLSVEVNVNLTHTHVD